MELVDEDVKRHNELEKTIKNLQTKNLELENRLIELEATMLKKKKGGNE